MVFFITFRLNAYTLCNIFTVMVVFLLIFMMKCGRLILPRKLIVILHSISVCFYLLVKMHALILHTCAVCETCVAAGSHVFFGAWLSAAHFFIFWGFKGAAYKNGRCSSNFFAPNHLVRSLIVYEKASFIIDFHYRNAFYPF